MKVSVGFSRHKSSLLSTLIRAAEDTEYSHVYIRRNSKYGAYVYQASGLQVNFMSIATFLESNIIVEEYEFDIPEDMHDELVSFCIKYAGRPYSIRSLLKIAAIMVFGLKFKGDGDDKFVCSELGAMFAKVILRINIPDDQDFVTPSRLNYYIKKYGKKII